MGVLLNSHMVEGPLRSSRAAAQANGVAAATASATVSRVGTARSMSYARASSFEQPAARYWRLFIFNNNGDPDFTGLTDIEMYEKPFGPNVLAGGTASASSFTADFTPAEGTNAVLEDWDGIAADAWKTASGGHLNCWLQYDFGVGVTKSIVAIGIHGRVDTQADQNPRDFVLQYSNDGSTWTNAWGVAGSINWTHEEFRYFRNPDCPIMPYSGSPWGKHTYWRVLVSEPAISWFNIEIRELEMRATPGGADQCSGGTATASLGNSSAPNAFDNISSTYWTSGSYLGNNEYASLMYEFASPVEVAEILMQVTTGTSSAPRIFALQFADSPTGIWTTAFKKEATGWSTSEARVFTDRWYADGGSMGEARARGRAAGVS